MAIALVGSQWGRVVAGALSFFTKATGTEFFRLGAGTVGFGVLEQPTIAAGVLTVTKPAVDPAPESGTADTVDSIVYAGAAAGDILWIHVPATNTITFDDAAINLAAATRAVAPGGSLGLIYDGTQWSEMFFTAATDNV